MQGKTVVVTGANSGIGEATAHELARRGARVVLVVRSEEKGHAAAERIRRGVPEARLEVQPCDLARLASVRRAAFALLDRYPRIDVLVNNAGLYLPKREVTEDGLEATIQINHFAPFLLTSLLAPRLLESAPARIVNVASEAHRRGRLRFDDLQSERRYAGFEVYGTSKLMNILHVRGLAKRLDPTKVTANALHPGVVATGFAQDVGSAFGAVFRLAAPLLLTPERGARTTVLLAADPIGAEVTGRYFAHLKERAPSSAALDDGFAERLWAESERLTGSPALP